MDSFFRLTSIISEKEIYINIYTHTSTGWNCFIQFRLEMQNADNAQAVNKQELNLNISSSI